MRLLHGSSLFLANRVFAQACWIGAGIVIARTTSPAVFGHYGVAFSLVLFLSVVAMLGLENTAVRDVSAALAGGDTPRAATVSRAVYHLALRGVGLTSFAFVVIGPAFLARVIHAPDLVPVLAWLVVWNAAVAFNQIQSAMMRGAHRLGIASLLDGSLRAGLTLLGFLLLAAFTRPTLASLLIVSAAAAIVSAVTGAIQLSLWRGSLGAPASSEALPLWNAAWPIMATTIIGFGLQHADIWLASALLSDADLARYTAAARLSFLTTMPMVAVTAAIAPRAAELYRLGEMAALEQLARTSATMTAGIALAVLVVYALLGRQLLTTLYGSFYAAGASILLVLTIGRLLLAWTGPCGTILLMAGQQRLQLTVTFVTAALLVVVAVTFSGRFDALDIAIAYGLVIGLSNVAMSFVARRTLGINTRADLSMGSMRNILRILRGGLQTPAGRLPAR